MSEKVIRDAVVCVWVLRHFICDFGFVFPVSLSSFVSGFSYLFVLKSLFVFLSILVDFYVTCKLFYIWSASTLFFDAIFTFSY